MDDDDPREWSRLHQEIAAFKKIKELINGPQERIPESLVRRTLAEQYGCKPEEVTLEQIHSEVSGLLPFYPALRLIPSKPIPVDPFFPDAPLSVGRLSATITCPAAARKMEAHLRANGIGLTAFAIQAQTTDRTLRRFRKSGTVRRDIFEAIARAMNMTKEELIRD